MRTAPALSSGAPTRPAALAAALLLALAGAVALRVGLAGVAGARAAGAGVVFGLVLLLVCVLAGARPGPLRPGTVLAGLVGGAALCVVPLAVRLSGDLAPLDPAAFPRWALVVTLVAVAEEVLLRGVLFDALAEHGDLLAVGVTTVAFAALHVPLYGWHVLPLDLVVGLWLAGLRLQTGGWGAPAVAHTVADLVGWWLR